MNRRSITAVKPRHLTVIPKTPAPDTPRERGRARIKAMPKPAEIAQCPLCVLCLARGERVVVR